jgi:hypothetical protein
MYVTIECGPQRYTVASEQEAECRRLLWAQMRVLTANDQGGGGSNLTYVARETLERGRWRNRERLRLVWSCPIEVGLKGPGLPIRRPRAGLSHL